MTLNEQTLPSDTFIRRLRAERERQGISQAQLAKEMAEILGVGIDPSAITRIEQQTRTVRLDEAVAIANVLQVPLAQLLMVDDGDENEAAIQRLMVELVAAHAAWDKAYQEINRISRTIQALSGGYGLYTAMNAVEQLDPELLDAIDDRAGLEEDDDVPEN